MGERIEGKELKRGGVGERIEGKEEEGVRDRGEGRGGGKGSRGRKRRG